jgi:hypothetical protein
VSHRVAQPRGSQSTPSWSSKMPTVSGAQLCKSSSGQWSRRMAVPSNWFVLGTQSEWWWSGCCRRPAGNACPRTPGLRHQMGIRPHHPFCLISE